ncbi:MAG: 30S ribosomal protein S17e [Candidatus Diapherotrites archaeon]
MGKAVPRGVKSRAHKLMELHEGKFSPDFEKNKEFINSLKLPFPRKIRNLIAGFITREAKAKSS